MIWFKTEKDCRSFIAKNFPGFETNRKMKSLISGYLKSLPCIFFHMSWQKFQFIFIQGISVSASADIDISKVDVYFNAEMCLTGDGCSLQIQVNYFHKVSLVYHSIEKI